MLLYGRGANSVAEQINATVQEAQELIDKFFNGFPKVREWIDNVHKFAHENGYVEGLLGRRRRLPDILLPRFSIECEEEDPKFFNPLLGTSEVSRKRNRDVTQKYQSLLEKAKTKRDRDVIREEALQENVKIKDNSGFIAQAERQSQNTLVQGGAATITKIAMIDVDRDEILNNLGFKMLICVHDEIIGECPRENADAAAKRLSEVMISSATTVCSVPMKCDCYEVSRWYEDDFSDSIHEKYAKSVERGTVTAAEAQSRILNEYPMIKPERLIEMMEGTYTCNRYEDI